MIHTEHIKCKLKFDISEPESDTITESYLFGFYKRTKKNRFKELTIHPIFYVEVKRHSEQDNDLSMYFDNALSSFDFGGRPVPKSEYSFDITDGGITCRNCTFKGVISDKPEQGMVTYKFIADYFEGILGDIQYCGVYRIPLNLNDNYIDYIKKHNCLRYG